MEAGDRDRSGVAEAALAWAERLRTVIRGPVLIREPLAAHTVFRIGGPADVLAVPQSVEELTAGLALCRDMGAPVTVIGRGSNLLVSDAGVDGVVFKIARGLSRLQFDGPRLIAQSGAALPAVAWQAAMHELSGLEFAVMIPGSIGGALVMNAGAHQHAIGPLVRWVRCLDPRGQEVVLTAGELAFAYRTSTLQHRHRDLVAVEAELELQPGRREAILARMQAHLDSRRRTQPLGDAGAGSIFRNPPGNYAGRLVEQAGLKGWRRGDVEVSPVHANFIVNKGHASCHDVLAVIRQVRQAVFERLGVTLELEVRLLGRFDEDPVGSLPGAGDGRLAVAPPPQGADVGGAGAS